ncbi:MAG: DNA-binding protein [Gammaproteobacteria bacterium]
MDKSSFDLPPGPSDGRLDSWKKIAVYLKKDVTTVQRWEKREGMPVHRHLHDKAGSVYAFKAELDAWVRSRRDQPSSNGHDPVLSPSDPAPTQGDSAPGDTAPGPPAAAPLAAAPLAATPLAAAPSISRLGRAAILIVAAVAVIAAAVIVWMQRTDRFWHNPIAGATYQSLTGFDGQNEAAAVSRDGQFVAFLSDRGGRTDVWITQVGSGQFHNLTHGIEGELVNPSVRTLGFSPDGSLVMFWLRRKLPEQDISIWAVPTLGGEPRPYLAGAAEAVWSPDGSQIAYHTPGPGDPLFITNGKDLSHTRPILVAPPGLHSHFQVWAPGNRIYFVKGSLPDQLDIWRVGLQGESAERITSQTTRVTYPVLLDPRTLIYLANSPDGAGPWIYGMDVERRVPHRLSSGVEQFTSLAASADGRRVIAGVSEPERTLWRVAISDTAASEASPREESPREWSPREWSPRESSPVRITLGTGSGFAPCLGPDYLLYVASAGTGESIWKIAGGAAVQLWADKDARIIGGPAVSADGRLIAFSVRERGQTLLYRMADDGTQTKIVSESLQLRGEPAFAPDGLSITSGAADKGESHLFRIPLEGGAPVLMLSAYSVEPTWSPDGAFVVYTGADVGTKVTVRAATAQGAPHALPPLTLTRGSRHLVLIAGGRKLVFLQGEMQHKNLWAVDLASGAMQQLTHMPAEFDVREFDISADGHDAVLERAQARSDVVMIDRASL